jgi:hypothetical protein
MCFNASLEQVKFVLEFVRYGVSRRVEYTRADMPWLKELAQRERARQRKLYELVSSGDRDLKVSPGRHCTWCPLLPKGCPVAETNPYVQMTPEQRLRFALWLQEAEKQNTKVVKELMVKHGPIRYRDENESEYVADFVPIEKRYYPYQDGVSILDEWLTIHPTERVLREKLTVSGLTSALKAEKRSELAQKLAAIVDVRVETELRIGREGKDWSDLLIRLISADFGGRLPEVGVCASKIWKPCALIPAICHVQSTVTYARIVTQGEEWT